MIHPSKNIRIHKDFEPANFVNCYFGFYRNASGFTLCVSKKLNELEKLGPKKGVISQSVKDVVQSLVDDDLVSKDKIGTSVYFWSLPSCAGNQLRNVYKKLEADLQTSKKRHVELVEQCKNLKKGHEKSFVAKERATVEPCTKVAVISESGKGVFHVIHNHMILLNRKRGQSSSYQ